LDAGIDKLTPELSFSVLFVLLADHVIIPWPPTPCPRKGRPGAKNIDPSDPATIRSWKQISTSRPMKVLTSLEDEKANDLMPREPYILRSLLEFV